MFRDSRFNGLAKSGITIGTWRGVRGVEFRELGSYFEAGRLGGWGNSLVGSGEGGD